MFLLDDSHLAVLYTFPFLIGLVLPGWRSIAVVGCAAVAFAIYASVTAGGGVASVLGLIFILTAVGGLCCGLLTRAATLWIAPLGRHPYRFMAVAVVGYLAPPILYSGPAETMAWLMRPSQGACAAATYSVTAANGTLRLTAAPVFAVDVLPSATSINVRHLSFDSEHGLKEICGRGLRDGDVIGPVSINLYPWKFGGSHVQQWAAATCASTKDKVLVLVCRLADSGHPGRRLERATIYGPEMAAAIARDLNYAVEKRLSQRLTDGLSADSLPPLRERAGGFEVYPGGLRIARAAGGAAETNEPFVLLCDGDESSTADKALFCGALDAVAGGLRIKFLFRSNGGRLLNDTSAIRTYLRELAAGLRGGGA